MRPEFLERVTDTANGYKLSASYIKLMRLKQWVYFNDDKVRGEPHDDSTLEDQRRRGLVAQAVRVQCGEDRSYQETMTASQDGAPANLRLWAMLARMCPTTQEQLRLVDRKLQVVHDPARRCGKIGCLIPAYAHVSQEDQVCLETESDVWLQLESADFARLQTRHCLTCINTPRHHSSARWGDLQTEIARWEGIKAKTPRQEWWRFMPRELFDEAYQLVQDAGNDHQELELILGEVLRPEQAEKG